jgi:hypothetical protein
MWGPWKVFDFDVYETGEVQAWEYHLYLNVICVTWNINTGRNIISISKFSRWLTLTIYEVPYFSFNYKTFLYLLKHELISDTKVICSYSYFNDIIR